MPRKSSKSLSIAPDTIGGRIAWSRMRKGLRQEELADALGKSRAAVAQYETGKNLPPLDVVLKIGEVLGVEPPFLAFGGAQQGVVGVGLPIHDALGGQERDGYRLPREIAQRAGLDGGDCAAYELPTDAPHFGLRRDDHVFVDMRQAWLSGDGKLYLLRTNSGDVILAKAAVQLGDHSGAIHLTLGRGEILEVNPDQLKVVGRVKAALRLE